ncbi:MAG: amidohydrolase family protein [Pseudomonadota bacterium]|nr:amidohydrolase family protein [Pseudomonadota bacterium]
MTATTPDAVSAVDSHAHVLRRDAPLAAERHSAPARDATVDEYLQILDAHGVSHAVLTAPSFYGPDNTLLLAALAAHPSRLRGTIIVAPDVDRDTLAQCARQGVTGIRLNWVRRDSLPDLTSPAYRRLLADVRALGLHVEIYLEGAKVAHVLPQLREAGVTVVVDHFGAPDPQQGLACPGFQQVVAGLRAGDTYVKLSAPYRLGGADPQPYVEALLEAGPHQLVWASDWPFVGYEDKITYRQCIDWMNEWVPHPATRRMIMVDNPMRLFGFQPTSG